ncbi:MAG TPA: hypothetical protein VHV32_02260 [Candidatus Angelobacter sp.]|nr:hypothetical protein [Candidatus Angelobacter sp.]
MRSKSATPQYGAFVLRGTVIRIEDRHGRMFHVEQNVIDLVPTWRNPTYSLKTFLKFDD